MPELAIHHALFTPAGRADPFTIYRGLRAEQPVSRTTEPRGFPLWLVARYGDCAEVLRDPRLTKDLRKLSPEAQVIYRSLREPTELVSQHMLTVDPPDHGRLRALVSRAFTPQTVEDMRPRVEAITGALLDAARGRETIDLVADFAFPLPVTVIAELLGVPAEDRDRFRAWSGALVSAPATEEEIEQQRASCQGFAAYFHDLIAERRAAPRDDLVSGLVQAEEAGDRLSPEELVGMLSLLLVAGHETTVNLIANGVMALMEHRDQWELLRGNPDLIGSAVEEMLRYCGPVKHASARWALEDVEISGQRVPAGELVLALILSANRDEAKFPDPDRFDLTRSPNKHLAFGAGIHFCLGAPLARLEAQVAINALLQRAPGMQLAVAQADLEWSTGLLLHGVRALPVALNGGMIDPGGCAPPTE